MFESLKKRFSEKRQRMFIMPSYQGAFFLQMIVLVGFVGLMMYFVSYFFFVSIFESSMQFGLSENVNFMRYLLDVHSQLVLAFVIAFAITAMIVLLYALRHSHRIAGPIYKIQNHMEQAIKENKFEELRFRENDYFQELAGIYSELMRKCQNEMKK